MTINMFSDIRRDIARYNRHGRYVIVAMLAAIYSHPAFLGLLHYRATRYFWLRGKNPVAKLVTLILRFLYPLVRMYSGVEIHPSCQLGAGAYFGHFGPIVIHPESRIGEQVTIMQGVSIGETRGGGYQPSATESALAFPPHYWVPLLWAITPLLLQVLSLFAMCHPIL